MSGSWESTLGRCVRAEKFELIADGVIPSAYRDFEPLSWICEQLLEILASTLYLTGFHNMMKHTVIPENIARMMEPFGPSHPHELTFEDFECILCGELMDWNKGDIASAPFDKELALHFDVY